MFELRQPLLAAAVKFGTLETLQYPLYGSPKFDGIRVLNHPDLGPVTRKLKPIPNKCIREVLSMQQPFIDGEILTYDKYGRVDDFNTIQSKVMSHNGTPEFRVQIIDYFEDVMLPFTSRYAALANLDWDRSIFLWTPQRILMNATEAEEFYQECIADTEGRIEGIMLREPEGPYKHTARSTLKQQILLKYKPTSNESAEGFITGFKELMTNLGEPEQDLTGYQIRKKRIANLEPADTLGALIVETLWGPLSIGSGFDATTRDYIWANRESLKGKFIRFKYQKEGMKDKPRFPIFLGFRKEFD